MKHQMTKGLIHFAQCIKTAAAARAKHCPRLLYSGGYSHPRYFLRHGSVRGIVILLLLQLSEHLHEICGSRISRTERIRTVLQLRRKTSHPADDRNVLQTPTLMVHNRKIREKIELDPRNPEYIKMVWGVGYKMEKGRGND
ncbi:hypothetical protein D3C71_1587270 [compost metagenome]